MAGAEQQPEPARPPAGARPDGGEARFLSHLRTLLIRRGRPGEPRPPTGRPVLPPPADPAALRVRFEQELLALGGSRFLCVRSVDGLIQPVLELLAEIGADSAPPNGEAAAASLLAPADPRLGPLIAGLAAAGAETLVWGSWPADEPAERWRARAAAARIGLAWADVAIAETGSVVFASRPDHGRSVTLLPPVIVTLFGPDDLVETRAEAFRRLRQTGALEAGAGIALVTGPSRTADIEGDLAIGVHGPGLVVAAYVDPAGGGAAGEEEGAARMIRRSGARWGMGLIAALLVAGAAAPVGAAAPGAAAAVPAEGPYRSEWITIEDGLPGARWRILYRGEEIADDELLRLAGRPAQAAWVALGRERAVRLWWQGGWALVLGGAFATREGEAGTGIAAVAVGALLLWHAWRTEHAYGRAPHHVITLPEAYEAARLYNESLARR